MSTLRPFLIVAMTADGFIAKSTDHAAYWTSREDKKRFVELTKRARAVVMGSRTFKTLPRPLKERQNIVYSRKEKFVGENVETTTESPLELMRRLEDQGYTEVAICGGSNIYTQFMKAKIIEKMYLTIEPIIFGTGIRLFEEELNFQLKLLKSETTEGGTLLLEYQVLYHGL